MKFLKDARWMKSKWCLFLLFGMLVLLIYGKTRHFGYSLDDHYIFQQIPDTGSFFTDLQKIFSHRFNNSDYRPFLILSYYFENAVAGPSHPGFSHVVNLLLYICLLFIIYNFTLKITAAQNLFPAFFITLLFLVHPIHANVVCNLKSRDNLLSMLFGLLACSLLFDFYVLKKHIFKLFGGYILFLVALCSKLDAMGFIVFITLLMITRKTSGWKILVNLGLLIQILYIIRLGLIPMLVPIDSSEPLVHVTITENPLILANSISDKLAAGIQTGWIYLAMMVKPFSYYFYYGFDQIHLLKFSDPVVYLYLLIQVCLILAALFSYKKNKLLFLSIFSFYGSLAYCLNVNEIVAGIVADRYAFIASLSFCMAIVSLSLFIKKEPQKKYFYYFLILYAVVLATFSFKRADAWKDKLTLIETDLPHLTRSYEAQRIAAATYLEYSAAATNPNEKKTFLNKALQHAETGNAIYPPNALMHKMEGMILFQMNQPDKAKEKLLTSFQHDSTSSETLEMLGDIHYVEKDYSSAQHYYRKARMITPLSNELVNKISSVIYESGDKYACLQYNIHLIESEPQLWAPYENLGYYYLEQFDTIQAKKYFELAKQKGLKDATPL